MKSRILWTSVLLVAVLLGGGAFALLKPGMPIRVGMTEEEVEQVLGNRFGEVMNPGSPNHIWVFGESQVPVEFDPSGRVVAVGENLGFGNDGQVFSFEGSWWDRFKRWVASVLP